MSKSYQYKGWPKGTRVEIVSCELYPALVGKQVEIFKERYYDSERDVQQYHIYANGGKYSIYESQLKFVAYPLPLLTWARQKVGLLSGFHPEIYRQLKLEEELGDLK